MQLPNPPCASASLTPPSAGSSGPLGVDTLVDDGRMGPLPTVCHPLFCIGPGSHSKRQNALIKRPPSQQQRARRRPLRPFIYRVAMAGTRTHTLLRKVYISFGRFSMLNPSQGCQWRSLQSESVDNLNRYPDTDHGAMAMSNMLLLQPCSRPPQAQSW